MTLISRESGALHPCSWQPSSPVQSRLGSEARKIKSPPLPPKVCSALCPASRDTLRSHSAAVLEPALVLRNSQNTHCTRTEGRKNLCVQIWKDCSLKKTFWTFWTDTSKRTTLKSSLLARLLAVLTKRNLVQSFTLKP